MVSVQLIELKNKADMMVFRSFYGQVPFILICTLIAVYRLPASMNGHQDKALHKPRLRDFDFAGIISFAAMIIILLFLLQAAGMKKEDQIVGVWTLASAFVLSSAIFLATEVFWAKSPLIPMHLLVQKLGAYCLIQILIFTGRMAVCFFFFSSFHWSYC